MLVLIVMQYTVTDPDVMQYTIMQYTVLLHISANCNAIHCHRSRANSHALHGIWCDNWRQIHPLFSWRHCWYTPHTVSPLSPPSYVDMLCECIYMYIYVFIYNYIYIYVFIYMYMYICIYVYMYIYACKYMYIYACIVYTHYISLSQTHSIYVYL